MFRKVALLAALSGVLLSIGGCSRPAADDGRLSIIAAFYPLAYAAQRVAGGAADVSGLTPPGAEPHDLELTPQQVAAIRDADLVIYLPGFQPAVDEAVAAEAGDRALDASAGLALLPAEGTGQAAAATDPAAGTDPHVWLNPLNLAAISRQVAARLTSLRPGQSGEFAAGLAAMESDMTSLDARWTRATTTCRTRDLVVSHAAFGYLAARYGFTQVGISGLVPDAEPAPATIASVSDFVRANDIRTIYYETLVDPKVATVIAQETGARTAVLDPVEGIAPGSTSTYITVMDANLATVVAGQPCS